MNAAASRTDVIAAFPVGCTVITNLDGATGQVTGHYTYNVSFIGMRTYVQVSEPHGAWSSEFVPAALTRVD